MFRCGWMPWVQQATTSEAVWHANIPPMLVLSLHWCWSFIEGLLWGAGITGVGLQAEPLLLSLLRGAPFPPLPNHLHQLLRRFPERNSKTRFEAPWKSTSPPKIRLSSVSPSR